VPRYACVPGSFVLCPYPIDFPRQLSGSEWLCMSRKSSVAYRVATYKACLTCGYATVRRREA